MDPFTSYILIRIAMAFVVSMGYGVSFLIFYEQIRKGIKENNRLRIWASFSGATFLLIMIVFLFSNTL